MKIITAARSVFVVVVIALCAGCASVPDVHQVKLDSDPQGAHIFLTMSSTPKPAEKARAEAQMNSGREYLGVTPCIVSITGDGDGYFMTPQITVVSRFVGGSATFTAEPPSGSTNLFAQSVTYLGNNHFVEGDKIPRGVFFDLHKPPP